ncbi:hypothetical protein KY317_02330 [Candidatus Woesearchaeota archaeon]|nr:hypothetical protein [Candidatus Woesearchaeota archaeon]
MYTFGVDVPLPELMIFIFIIGVLILIEVTIVLILLMKKIREARMLGLELDDTVRNLLNRKG